MSYRTSDCYLDLTTRLLGFERKTLVFYLSQYYQIILCILTWIFLLSWFFSVIHFFHDPFLQWSISLYYCMIWWTAYSGKLYYYLYLNSFLKKMLLRHMEYFNNVSLCHFYLFIYIIYYFNLLLLFFLCKYFYHTFFLGIINPVPKYFLFNNLLFYCSKCVE